MKTGGSKNEAPRIMHSTVSALRVFSLAITASTHFPPERMPQSG